jgi:putative ABC transport system ATP-binding protein/lipoprotein-releasing system ATP-binding protein
MIKAVEITKSFGQPPVSVLKPMTFEIPDGELVTIIGKSGSGKSTLLYLLSSLDRPTSGDIYLGDRKISDMTVQELHHFRNQFMGFVFQFHHLLPELTALENVLMPARKSHQEKTLIPFARELLTHFGIDDKENRLPSELSGGEQQRVAIARALVMRPKYIFADEPTGNLDSTNAKMVMDLLTRVNAEEKTTVIYVTHDQELAAMAKRKIHLVDGQIQGTPL